MELIIHTVLSVLFGISFAILMVEKGDSWPVTLITKPLSFILNRIYPKIAEVLNCTVCFSFWATLVGEIALYFAFTHVFMWPFTGIISLGITWLIIEFFNILEKLKQ